MEAKLMCEFCRSEIILGSLYILIVEMSYNVTLEYPTGKNSVSNRFSFCSEGCMRRKIEQAHQRDDVVVVSVDKLSDKEYFASAYMKEPFQLIG